MLMLSVRLNQHEENETLIYLCRCGRVHVETRHHRLSMELRDIPDLQFLTGLLRPSLRGGGP